MAYASSVQVRRKKDKFVIGGYAAGEVVRFMEAFEFREVRIRTQVSFFLLLRILQPPQILPSVLSFWRYRVRILVFIGLVCPRSPARFVPCCLFRF
jgi:hypothetical protein